MNGDGLKLLFGLLIAYLMEAETSFAKEIEKVAHLKPRFASIGTQDPPDSRIYNGITATVPLPFIASIQVDVPGRGWVHFCGGSLINPNKILTAAHCFDELEKPPNDRLSNFRVALGSTHHLLPEVSVEFKKTDVTIDSRYRPNASYVNPIPYDFAKIRLSQQVKLSRNVQIISLARYEYNGTVTIAGWGHYDCINPSLYLLFMQGITVPKDRCEEIWLSVGDGTKITFGQEKVCAVASDTSSELAANPDRGDSGGPLYFQDSNEKPVLLGIASFGALQEKGSKCFRTEVPFVYSKVSENLGFIEAGAVLNISIICKVLICLACTCAFLFSSWLQ